MTPLFSSAPAIGPPPTSPSGKRPAEGRMRELRARSDPSLNHGVIPAQAESSAGPSVNSEPEDASLRIPACSGMTPLFSSAPAHRPLTHRLSLWEEAGRRADEWLRALQRSVIQPRCHSREGGNPVPGHPSTPSQRTRPWIPACSGMTPWKDVTHPLILGPIPTSPFGGEAGRRPGEGAFPIPPRPSDPRPLIPPALPPSAPACTPSAAPRTPRPPARAPPPCRPSSPAPRSPAPAPPANRAK